MMYKQLTSEQRYVISAGPAYAQRQATARKQRMCKPLLNRISIDQRPPEVDGKRFGDWEMDT